MSPRNWPDLPHGCKLSQLETAMQLIQRSIRWTDPMTETKSQWVSPAAPLASPLKLFSTGFLEHICSYKSSSQTGTCKPSPRDGISQMCTYQYMWSQPVIWWDQGGERKWSWEKIWTRANLSPGPFSLLFSPCSPELAVGAAQLCVHVCHDILCILSEGTKTEGWVSSATSNLTKVRFLWIFVFIFIS